MRNNLFSNYKDNFKFKLKQFLLLLSRFAQISQKRDFVKVILKIIRNGYEFVSKISHKKVDETNVHNKIDLV